MDSTVFTVVYDTENFCDGFDSPSYDDAVGSAMDILLNWMYNDDTLTWTPWSEVQPTQDQVDAWNYLIESNEVRIYKHAAGSDLDDEDIVWYMDRDDVESIGWKEV